MVLSPAPTANGDLHLGHIAGPFLAADVFTRYARAAGHEAVLGTGAQDSPTYVVTTAQRLGVDPGELAERSTKQIEATLAAIGIAYDGFTRGDDRYTKTVLNFVDRLHSAGKLRLRAMPFPYSPRTGQYLVDGYVRGGCPVCLADGCAGICESCGHPCAAGELVEPRSTEHPGDPLELREVEVLVLPLEEHRAGLAEYFERTRATLRPHMAQAIAEMLARPLPDYPITYPTGWGIRAPYPEVAGQVVNPNAEAGPWPVAAAALAAEAGGAVLSGDDDPFLADSGWRTVLFHGFDNTFPFGIALVAMLLANGDRYALPERFVANEFYELETEKFSTSRGHAVWGCDLAAEVPRDLIRFYLAVTSPEHQRTDFSRAVLERIAISRLVDPWNRVVAKAAAFAGRTLPVSARSRTAVARMGERFAACYELDAFSLHRAAGAITEQLARLDRLPVTDARAGDFCHEVDALLRCAAPILIDLAARAGVEPGLPAGSAQITVRPLPRLSTAVA
ncbi:class I tRNA ligase family protein [Actinokineospora sp. NPDC004072]